MTRQQRITLDQCYFKRDEAHRRANQWMNRALDAKSEKEYDDNVREMTRAASDAQTWQKVIDSLEK